MIIAFRTNVEGVLLASSAIKEHPDSKLIFAGDKSELDKKLRFSCENDDILTLGFDSKYNIFELIRNTFGKRRTGLAPHDPGPERYIDLVLRHRKTNPIELVHMIASCKGDASLLYCGKTNIARRYYRYMREVNRASHSLSMFVRPDIINGILTARIDTEHDVADIFCRWLANKNSDMPVAVICGNRTWIGNGHLAGVERFGSIDPENLKELGLSPSSDIDIEEMWNVYYDSQMIENRRNRSLAKKLQPKYTGSLSNMAKNDRYKVERGIANCTLDSFT